MTSGSALAKSAEDVVDVEDVGKETTIINYVEPRVRDCLKMFLYRREIARKDFKEYMDARELAKGKTSPKNSEKQLSEARVFFSKTSETKRNPQAVRNRHRTSEGPKVFQVVDHAREFEHLAKGRSTRRGGRQETLRREARRVSALGSYDCKN